MPNGPTHDRITIALASVGAVACLYWGVKPAHAATFAAATLVSGLLLSPDLDLHSSSYVRWGPLRFIWWPYKEILPHRSFISHGLFVGANLRIVYFVIVLFWMLTFSRYFYVHAATGKATALMEVAERVAVFGWKKALMIPYGHAVAAWIGVEVGAESHVAADWIGSKIKPRQKK